MATQELADFVVTEYSSYFLHMYNLTVNHAMVRMSPKLLTRENIASLDRAIHRIKIQCNHSSVAGGEENDVDIDDMQVAYIYNEFFRPVRNLPKLERNQQCPG